MALGFFGQELGSDDDIEIILHNPAVAAWFQRNAGRQGALRQWQENRNPTTARRVINLAKTAAKAVGVVSTIITALSTNNAREERQEGEMTRVRRHRDQEDEEKEENLERNVRPRTNDMQMVPFIANPSRS